MRIKKVRAIPVFFKLFKPFIYAGVKLEILDYVLVRIETEEGVVGYGECPVYWNPRGETQESTLRAIEKITPFLIGVPADDAETRMKMFAEHIPQGYAAQCGLDLAMYDAAGKSLGRPVYDFFGSPHPVAVEVAIPMVSVQEAEQIIGRALQEKVKVFKVKVGQDAEKEIQVLQILRRLIGSDLKIFVDANQGFKTPKEVGDFIKKIFDLNIAWIEQPLPASTPIEEWAKLKKQLPVKIMLDESAYTYEDVIYFSENDAGDLFNIKLAKSGGISGAVKMLRTAKQYGKECMLGSMIEGALGIYGGLHFASTHDLITTALATFRYIDDELAYGPEIKDSIMRVPNLPGLGCGKEELFEKRFQEYKKSV